MKIEITHDHQIDETGIINVRRITRIFGDDGEEMSKTYHRHVVDPWNADLTKENAKTRMLCECVTEINELDAINDQIADGMVVDEGEDAEVEAAKLADGLEKKAGFWSRLFNRPYTPETRI